MFFYLFYSNERHRRWQAMLMAERLGKRGLRMIEIPFSGKNLDLVYVPEPVSLLPVAALVMLSSRQRRQRRAATASPARHKFQS